MRGLKLAAAILFVTRTLVWAGGETVSKRHGAFVPRDPASKRYQANERAKLEAGDDQASEAARRDYETRLLGADSNVPAAGSLVGETAKPADRVQPQADAASAPSDVFVALDLESRTEDLKDAVAGLQTTVGFRPDARFPPQRLVSGLTERVSVRGWMPAARIGDAARAPGVTRLELDRLGSRGYTGATTAMLVGIRVPAQDRAADTFRRVIQELAESARFRWTHTVGFQALPGRSDLALVVVGEVPIAKLSRLMGHPDVLKVAPASPRAASGSGRSASGSPTRVEKFGRFVLQRAPVLLALTLLLLIPAAGGLVVRLLKSFIPYH